MDETVLEKRRVLTLANGVTLELREAGGVFAGIGRVCSCGVELRNPDEPMYFVIRTPSGVEFTNFRLEEVRPEDGGFRLGFGMERRETDLMEWMTHAVRPRRNLNPDRARLAPAADTRQLPLPVPKRFRRDLQIDRLFQLGAGRPGFREHVPDAQLLCAVDHPLPGAVGFLLLGVVSA